MLQTLPRWGFHANTERMRRCRGIEEAIERHYGAGADCAAGYGEQQSAFDCSKIERAFGWKPRYSCWEQ